MNERNRNRRADRPIFGVKAELRRFKADRGWSDERLRLFLTTRMCAAESSIEIGMRLIFSWKFFCDRCII